jgi:7,8-dihydropterin-6-yl-methyl-4-(beta-D-ribofuranosyl)aminobenzene 5'-phosphate synthase
MRVTIVYDNEVLQKGLSADWGFSCLIEGEGIPRILFDTGARGQILLHNMKQLGLDPSNIEAIFISHSHLDHTGGLPHILELAPDAVVYVPASFSLHIPGRQIVTVNESIRVSEQSYSTGELEGIEQSLLLENRTGITVITGCSHPGVGRIIDAASRYGRVNGIVGGFDGFRDFDRLEGLSLICPCHCTMYKKEIKRLFPEQCTGCGAGLVLDI